MPTASACLSYDGRHFRPAGNSAAAGHYHQQGSLVWAEFAGPGVPLGRLAGTVRADGTIDAAYCFVDDTGTAVTGTCVSVPRAAADGRVALTEHWRRPDGSAGVTELEEDPGVR